MYRISSSLSVFLFAFYVIIRSCRKIMPLQCAKAYTTDFCGPCISFLAFSISSVWYLLEVCSERRFVTGVFSSCSKWIR